MISLDTNVLVRCLTLDDPAQVPARVKVTESMADRAAPAVVQPRLVRPCWFVVGVHVMERIESSRRTSVSRLLADWKSLGTFISMDDHR